MYADNGCSISPFHLRNLQGIGIRTSIHRIVYHRIAIMCAVDRLRLRTHPLAELHLQQTRTISCPTLQDVSVGSYQHEMRNTVHSVACGNAVSSLQVVPIVPCQRMRLYRGFPPLLAFHAQTDYFQTVLMLFAKLFQFGLRLNAGTASPAPEIEQDIFPTELTQMMHLALQVIQISVNCHLSIIHHYRRIECRIDRLSFLGILPFIRQTFVKYFHLIPIWKLLIIL